MRAKGFLSEAIRNLIDPTDYWDVRRVQADLRNMLEDAGMKRCSFGIGFDDRIDAINATTRKEFGGQESSHPLA